MKLFHLTSEKYGLQALRNWRLKLSLIQDLNDPFELYAAALTDPRYRAKFREFKNHVSKSYGMICFSRHWSNPVLWSHYGDRHQGIALEIDVQRADVCKVIYSPARIFVDVEAAMKRGSFLKEDAYRLVRTKFQHWQYEDERRVFVSLSDRSIACDKGLHFYPFGAQVVVTGVILGAASTLSNETIAQNLQLGRTISVTRTRLAFESFTVVRQRRLSTETVAGIAGPTRQRKAGGGS